MKVAAQKQMVKNQSQAENGAIRLQVSVLQYYCGFHFITLYQPRGSHLAHTNYH